MAPSNASPPALQEATRQSTIAWQHDLESLFFHAKDRFPDVVWEVSTDSDDKQRSEEVWGHKAIVYARAPPSFQARYFSLRPQNSLSPSPYSSSPNGNYLAASGISLPMSTLDVPGISRSPSPCRTGSSPAPSAQQQQPGQGQNTMLRLSTPMNSTLFSNELEYLYTGKGFGEAFEFLFDSSEAREEGDAQEQRIDKLRKDLVFMWRSRLYSDVRIALTGTFSSTNHESSTAIFSTHRFLLVSRSPYFHTALISWGTPKGAEQQTLTLPSPPFTPASLHFTLGFLYTGTLIFSNRTYDLDTAFHIMCSATYLSLDTLYNEIQARIVQEMMHGLFHAFLEFAEYERVTGGKWGTGGCRCRQCARRTPRVLEFALSPDVNNQHLERGARRALVGLFGEGWCNSEFANLDHKYRESVLRGLAKRTTPMNIFALLFSANHALHKLGAVIDPWADITREMVHSALKTIDNVLCTEAEKCFEQVDWLEILENDGAGFDDAERVEWIMASVKRGLSDKNAAMVYQVLVSSILLRPHPSEKNAPMLSGTSHIRVQVEETRMDVLKWIGKRWLGIRQEGGFDDLDGWAIKEISHDIEVPVEDLQTPVSRSTPTKVGPKSGESDTTSVVSLRATVLKGHAGHTGKRAVTPTRRDPLASSASSVRSVARSTLSTTSRASTSTAGPTRRNHTSHLSARPDSKLTPMSPSSPLPNASPNTSSGSIYDSARSSTASVNASPSITVRSVTSPTPPSINGTHRPRSLAPSVSSVKSRASTLRNGTSSQPHSPAGPSALRPPPVNSRSISSASNRSDGSTTFKTAHSDARSVSSMSRTRKTSAASTTSNISVKTTGTATAQRARRLSSASATSTLSTAAKAKKPPVPSLDSTRLGPGGTTRRSVSQASIRSTASNATTNSTAKRRGPVLKSPATVEKKVPAPVNNVTPTPSRVAPLKGKDKASIIIADDKSAASSSGGSGSTITIKRKASTDTITRKSVKGGNTKPPIPSSLKDPLPSSIEGATLDIGIPCIISLKRKRFKAFARYIGEVAGESGPWVGVEVPFGENWSGDTLVNQWNDGSWGGIRYFEIGSGGSEWEYGGGYGDDRASRRRKLDLGASSSSERSLVLGMKRELLGGDGGRGAKRLRSVSPAPSDVSSSESRGLFVRPQQVLYVVDAVGADL